MINLSPSLAITQNFVPASHLVSVLAFLKERGDQVSGFRDEVRDPYALFVEKMQGEFPEMLAVAIEEMEKRSEGRKRKWDAVVGNGEEEGAGGGFSFGFGGESDEEIP